MNWTPVTEKNPSKQGLYLVTVKCRDGSRIVDEDWYYPEDTIGNPRGWMITWPTTVVAWMEKPEKYGTGKR